MLFCLVCFAYAAWILFITLLMFETRITILKQSGSCTNTNFHKTDMYLINHTPNWLWFTFTSHVINIILFSSFNFLYQSDEQAEYHQHSLHFPFSLLSLQLRVTQQDGSPIQGKRSDVSVSVRCTYEEETTTTPDYYYSAPTHSYDLPEQMMAVPDAAIVAVQVPIPENSTEIYVEVNINLTSNYVNLLYSRVNRSQHSE